MENKFAKAAMKMAAAFITFSTVISFCGCAKKPEEEKLSGTVSIETTAKVEQEKMPMETASDDVIDPENLAEDMSQGDPVNSGALEKLSGKENGIDVSKWQGKIDWNAVKADGIDFAVIRIGFRGENGNIYKDGNGDYNLQKAIEAGLLAGVYFFSNAISVQEAEAEAHWVAEAIAGYGISYPVVYDCEGYTNPESRMYSLSVMERTENALAFLRAIESYGYEGAFYASRDHMVGNAYWDMSQIENNYKVWVAHYSSPAYPQTQNPDYSGKYSMWQYTNCGSVSGVEGNCDMIVSYFEANEVGAKDQLKAPTTVEVPKTQEQMQYEDANDSVTAKEAVNLREGAGTKYGVVARLESGTFLKRTGIGKNGWSRLEYMGQTVYAITSYLTTEVIPVETQDIVIGMLFEPVSDRVTAKIEVNLRSLPSTDSQICGTLVAGTFLDRTAVSQKGWSRLSYNGQTVYAVSSYLTSTVPEENTEQSDSITEHGMTFTPVSVNVTAKQEVNLRDKPSTDGSNVVYTLKNGEYVQKVGESNSGWARLVYNGQIVYAINSYLTQ